MIRAWKVPSLADQEFPRLSSNIKPLNWLGLIHAVGPVFHASMADRILSPACYAVVSG